MRISRRKLCSAGTAITLSAVSGCLGGSDERADEPNDDWTWSGTLPVTTVVQHHDPSCGCCSAYADYLDDHGFAVELEETADPETVKRDLAVPQDAWSCHTIEFGDYLVEGHVPLEAIERLFEEEPAVRGIAAPGMPKYSPGMGPRGDDPLSIVAFEEGGDVFEYVEV